MKRFMKNKNFIPDKFYYKIEKSNNKYESIIAVVFLLLNLYLLPDLSREISKINNKTSVNSNIKQDKNELSNVNRWIKNIWNDNISEVHITNGNGEIVIDSVDKIKELNLDKSININGINYNNEKKYKLGVSLND